MKNWEQAKAAYIKDHLSKPLKAPNIRLNALKKIEATLQNYAADIIADDRLFDNYDKERLMNLYKKYKGYELNSAENQCLMVCINFPND